MRRIALTTERREVANLDELANLLTIDGVSFTKFEGHRAAAPEDAALGVPTIGLKPTLSEDGLQLQVALFATLIIEEAHFDVTVEVQYKLAEPIAEVKHEIMGAFLGRSTMVTCGPFLREAFFSLGQRLQVPPPLMELVAPGDMVLKNPAPAEETGSVGTGT